LTLLSELGIFGLVAFGALGAVWLKRAANLPAGSRRAQDLRVSCALGVLALTTASLAVPMSSAKGLFPIALAGLAISGIEPMRAQHTTRATVIVSTIVLGVALIPSFMLSSSGAYMQHALSAQNVRDHARSVESAARLMPGSTRRSYEMLYSEVLRVGKGLEAAEFMDMYGQAPESMRTFAPYATDLVRRLSRAETTPEVLRWADSQLAVATEIAPAYPESFMERAWVAYSLGRQQEGAEYWEQASWASRSAIYQTYVPEIARLSK